MKFSGTARSSSLEDRTFLLLLVAVTIAFVWVLWPFYGAVFWGAILALLFAPLYRVLLRKFKQRRTLAALGTVAVILLLVILPLALVSGLLVQEAAAVYQRVQSGELSVSRYFQQIHAALPAWVVSLLDRFGLGNLGLVQERLSLAITRGSQFLTMQALNIGQMKIGQQIAPGVPWCHALSDAAGASGLHLALKSGNFGGDDFFTQAFTVLA